MALPGVGEALKREIAGLGLLGRLLLWGFERWACVGFDLTKRLNGLPWAKRRVGLVSILSIRAEFCQGHQLLSRR